ncbi:hypothetical protein N9A94_06535 [Akkermansiaceae bacterium]|nr:hypothetical protein [Akkermansiaceae bacterium]MDB4537507.1 hypothetical protein [Akkermansiaceae bacterium]
MLQQTTVVSVIANQRFEKFLADFPDVASIAEAPEPRILKAWEGLGYYNRVRNLQKTARAIIADYGGKFPKEASELKKLPGIGDYTAGAVSSFAFDQPAPIVDGNIARVIARLLNYQEPVDSSKGQKEIWQRARELLDRKSPRVFNSAIMELGQTFCTAREAQCLSCPVHDFCQSTEPLILPLKKPRKKFVAVSEHAFLAIKGEGILLAKETGSRRKGFWRLPLRSEDECAHLSPESQHRYTITHHRVTVNLYRGTPPSINAQEQIHALDSLDDLPIASPMRKIINSSL